MQIKHKNSIQSYVGEFLKSMNIKARAEGKPSSGLSFPQPVQSLMRHELNLCLMLEIFDECLTRFEKSLNGKKEDCDFDAYFMANAFLDTIYLFTRMLLDSAAGIVRHKDLYRYKDCKLPESFNDILKKAIKNELPDNLGVVFLDCKTWFPQLKNQRDDIVHHYETNFIVFGQNSEGEKIAKQFSPRKKTPEIKDLRSYIGMVMAGYQCFVDKLLDYWDEMFLDWYNISFCRNSTIFMGRSANILWWAYKYGGYRNDNMVVSE
jgi:hypothetical protein